MAGGISTTIKKLRTTLRRLEAEAKQTAVLEMAYRSVIQDMEQLQESAEEETVEVNDHE